MHTSNILLNLLFECIDFLYFDVFILYAYTHTRVRSTNLYFRETELSIKANR